MKGFSDRTKVVLRHLPPAISQSTLKDQIDAAFAGRYHWVAFRPGKSSMKHQFYTRAYIDFKKPEDVIEFAEFFDGHLFVSEKGTQFKTIVEYAPSQRVPKQWSKKDGREGTILKDPEYLEFLEYLAKPVENLPSAEIQLERREAERGGAAKDALVVTPLMDFVRQKRAAKGGSRRSLSNGKLSRRAVGSSTGNRGASSKRGSERRRISSAMYVLRDTVKNMSGKDKSMHLLVPNRDDERLFDKSVTVVPAARTEVLAEESGISGTNESGKKKLLLLKGKEREILHGSVSLSKGITSSVGNTISSAALKQNQQHQGSERIVKRILLNKDSRQSQSFVGLSEQQIQATNLEKDKRPPRPPHAQLILKDPIPATDDKVADGSHTSDEPLSSSASQLSQSLVDSFEGSLGDTQVDMANARCGEVKNLGTGRSSHSSIDNGSHKHFGRRGPAHVVKDTDGSSIVGEGKHLRKGTGYISHEKQVWVQKSSSGS
ncbi:regulator of nonsense transcripts UPF3-like isoform X4 [Carya illinoinensis]|uniref:regulator of nonsense transcripts UPF3-like isoform X4 n=1 Tax=Carya illinoinensis TaxID=32201 RepID=UPI001C722790|nr:regulator of nonsense transcripts UPF3-like isoform X4 [Carya illinoinensis]